MGICRQFVRWVSVTHAQRWHGHYETRGTGRLYEGRFKSFPVESDEHFLTVRRYVERNALRGRLMTRSLRRSSGRRVWWVLGARGSGRRRCRSIAARSLRTRFASSQKQEGRGEPDQGPTVSPRPSCTSPAPSFSPLRRLGALGRPHV